MTTMSFYARGDGASANNAALNIDNTSQQPTVLITFDSGPTGDIVLEANGGAPDPDTTVIIDGISYDFIVEQTGDLPIGNGKIPDILEGRQITVISVIINGSYERFFFLTDGSGTLDLMNQLGNGAVALENTNTSPTEVFICFCENTDILTPNGYKKVETLKAGDLVLTDAGNAVPIIWVGQSRTSVEDMLRDPTRTPVCIPAHSVSSGVPHADLYVSAAHRVVLQSFWTEFYFGEPKVLVAAKHLLGTAAKNGPPDQDVTYFHILLERHDVLISNGLPTESFQPSWRSFRGISAPMRRSLADTVPPKLLQSFFKRPDAMRTLKAHEAKALVQRMLQRDTQVDTEMKDFALVA